MATTKKTAKAKTPKKAKAPTKAVTAAIPSYPNCSGLTDSEQSFLNDLIAKGRAGLQLEFAESAHADFYVQGGFTVCELSITMPKPEKRKKYERVVAPPPVRQFGVSKCNWQDDEFSAERGRKIALARAARGEAQESRYNELAKIAKKPTRQERDRVALARAARGEAKPA